MFARLGHATRRVTTASTVAGVAQRGLVARGFSAQSEATSSKSKTTVTTTTSTPSVRTFRNTFDNWGVSAEVAPEGGGYLAEEARKAALEVHEEAKKQMAIVNDARRQERRKNLAMEDEAVQREKTLAEIAHDRITRPIEITPDTDLTFLTGTMKLKHHYNTVSRGQKDELSSGLYNQMRLLVKLAKNPPAELLAHLNIHRLASLAWRLLHTENVSATHCEAIVRMVSHIPRGRQAPEVQHVGGARSKAWFVNEAHDFAHPAQLNAIYFNRNFEYYKTWVQETSTPAGLIVNFVLSLKLKNRPVTGFMEGELTAALVELGRFEEALVQTAANLKRAAHLSTSAIETYAYDYPSFANILDKIGAPALPPTTTNRGLLKKFTTAKGLEAAIMAAVQTEAYNIAPQYYTLLQQIKGLEANTAVPDLAFDAACAMTVALSHSLGKDETPEYAKTRADMRCAIVRQALADGVFVTGSDAKSIDLSQFSDPEVASAVLVERLAQLKESGNLGNVSVRLMSHNELLAQKVSAKQAAEAEAGAALSTEQQRELRQMLSQLDLVFETDISTADFGGLGDAADAVTVRQLRTKFDTLAVTNPELALRFGPQAAVAGNNTIRPMSEISAKAGITEVGKPDALVRLAVAKVLEDESIAFSVNDKSSSLLIQ